MITMETAEKALKTVYLGVVAEQLNLGVNPLLAKIEQTSSDVWGKDVVKLVSYGINGGISSGKETDDLPKASGNHYAQLKVELKNLFGSIEISDKAVRASENSSGAFVNLLNAEIEGLLKASKLNFSRMIYGNGTGVLTKIKNVATGALTKINVDKATGLFPGMIVDIVTPSGYVVGEGLKVVSVDMNAKAITVESNPVGAILASDNYSLIVQKSYKNELTGLGAIFGAEDLLYGLSKTQNPWLKPSVNAVNSTLTAAMFQKAIDEGQEKHGVSEPDIIISSYDVRRAMVDYLSFSRLNVDYMSLDGGYKALTFNGIPWVADRFVDAGSAYILNSADFKLHQLCDWRWLEGNGGKILRQIEGKPVYRATLVKYAELICDRPFAQSMLTGIDTTLFI
ncbi:MAG: phage major capsid protein [Clostridiales bacterium]|jgi:hypothetical protein|nr:phage major capsid protein [Clostridiales bacterium]